MTYYEILQVNDSASIDVIKAAYRILAQKYHPDKNNSIDADRIMKDINSAYEILSNEIKRKAYDETLKNKSESTIFSSIDEKVEKFSIIDFKTKAKGTLEIGESYIKYGKNTLIVDSSFFVSLLLVSQKTLLNNFGDKYIFKFSNNNKNIEIEINNKNNNGKDKVFRNIVDLLIKNFSNNIINNLILNIKTKGYYNINSVLELGTNGVFIIANKMEAKKIEDVFIPYDLLNIDFDFKNIFIINTATKKTVTINNNLLNNILFIKGFLAKIKSSLVDLGNLKSEEETIWEVRENSQKDIFNFNKYHKDVDKKVNSYLKDISIRLYKGEPFEYIYNSYVTKEQQKYITHEIFEIIYQQKIKIKSPQTLGAYVNNNKFSSFLKINKKYMFAIIMVISFGGTILAFSPFMKNKIVNSYLNKSNSDEISLAYSGGQTSQFKLGEKYEKAKNYTEAYKWYSIAAKSGFSDAQNNLGVLIKNGFGVEKNYKEAFKWFALSSQQNNSEAQYNLATIYYNGEGVKQSYSEAFRWYKYSATQGNKEAQYFVGIMLSNAQGVEKNNEEAAQWYFTAAKQGHHISQHNLGLMYYKGIGVRKNYAESLKWILIAEKTADSRIISQSEVSGREIIKNNENYNILKEVMIISKHCIDTNYNDCPELDI